MTPKKVPPFLTVCLLIVSVLHLYAADEVVDLDLLPSEASEVSKTSSEAEASKPSSRSNLPPIDEGALKVAFGDVNTSEDVITTIEPGSDGGKAETAVADLAEDFLATEDQISVNFPDEEIRVILRSVADLYGLNLIIPDTLVGRTSIKLRDVQWRRVFDATLKPIGYTYTEDRNVIEVVSVAQLNLEPQQIRTFAIKYAKASEIAESIGDIIEGSIQVDNRSNSLVIKDRPSVLSQIDRLLSESTLDRPTLQVMIQAKFIEVQETSGKPAGSDVDGVGLDWWSAGAPFGTGTGAAPFLSWGLNTSLDVLNNFPGKNTGFKTAVFSENQFALALRWLETTNRSNLVASPTVVVLNNEMTKLHVGRKQPIIEANFDATTGNFTVGEVTYLPIGVQLDVTPRVNAGADQITLFIKPKVSRIVGSVDFKAQQGGGSVISYPIESIRETETKVNIRNGYTLAIGGLAQDDDIDKVEKAPFLGDLPYVGRIFQRRNKDKEKIDLIMFLTASVLNPDGSTYKDVVDPRMVERMGLASSDILGYESKSEVPGLDRMPDDEREFITRLQEMRDEFVRRKYLGEVNKQMPVDSYPESWSGKSFENKRPEKTFNPDVVKQEKKGFFSSRKYENDGFTRNQRDTSSRGACNSTPRRYAFDGR